MYNNNSARFPIGDNGDDLELIELLTRGRNIGQRRCERDNNHSDCEREQTNCGDCRAPRFGEDTALAMVYSPDHKFDDMYDIDTALERGTLFKGLDKPFRGMTISGGMCK